jgi:predicted Zn-dependent protease
VGAAVLAALPPLWRSSFVRQRRAAVALHRAEDDIAAGRLDKAVAGLRTALRLRPGDARARTQLAATELARGQWEIAFLEYQELTDLHPEDPDGWIGLGDLMLKTGLLATPEAALDKAIARAPERAGSRLLRAQIRYRVGRFHGAQLDARAAAQSTPPDPSAGMLVRCIDAKRAGAAAPEGCERAFGAAPVPAGRVRAEAQAGGGKLASLSREHWPGRMAQMRQALEIELRKQDWNAAERTVASARQAYPDGPFAPFLAGIVELGRGRPEDAEAQFFAALAAAPRSAVVVAALAKSWSRRGGAMVAADRLLELAEKDPGFAFARDIAARAYMDARDPGKAEAALRRGLVLEPDSAVPYEQLADFYVELDRPADALGIAQQGAERFPHDAAVQLSMGRILADSGKPEDAIRVYRDLLSGRPDLDVAAYRIAALADKDEAAPRAAVLRDLGTDHPSDPMLLDALGWLEAHAGDPRRAQKLLEAARDAAPDEPASHYHLAVLYGREKRSDLAREELKAAVDSGRPFAERLEALRLLRQGENPAKVRP